MDRMTSRQPASLTHPHRTGCGCFTCCKVDAAHEALDESVDDRIAAMGWLELRGLSWDYRDMVKRTKVIPFGGFRGWLRDRVADQLIAKQYNDERSWF